MSDWSSGSSSCDDGGGDGDNSVQSIVSTTEQDFWEREHGSSVDSSAASGVVSPSSVECTLCLKLMVQPVTTPCGHSFCRMCLREAVVHKPACPLCRAGLNTMTNRLAVSTDLARILQTLFPREYANRMREMKADQVSRLEAERSEEHSMDCFILSPILPRQRMRLYMFEPRYRFMTERALESSLRFGMVAQFCEFGTEVEILESNEMPGGYFLHVIGRRIFEVKSTQINPQNGLLTAGVTFVDPDRAEFDVERTELEQMDLNDRIVRVDDLFEEWREAASRSGTVADDLCQRIASDLGSIPPHEQPADRVLWIAALINVVHPSEPRLVGLLKATTTVQRLSVAEAYLTGAIQKLNKSQDVLTRGKFMCKKTLHLMGRHPWLVGLAFFAAHRHWTNSGSLPSLANILVPASHTA